jgi:hypothetical protein
MKRNPTVSGAVPGEDIGREWELDYRESHLAVLFRRGTWHSWDEAIAWLQTHGEADEDLTPGEMIAMKQDFQRLRDLGVPFTDDPAVAYQRAHHHRDRA